MSREHRADYPLLTVLGGPGEGASNMGLITKSLLHHLDAGHRLAARDSVPTHVNIPTDAKVTTVEEDGRVTGVWVDAKVFVQLRPEQ